MTSRSSARSEATGLPASLSSLSLPLVQTHRCLVPVETPLSYDGELSARHGQHRSAEHFEAVVHDTTWLLHQALSSGGSRHHGRGHATSADALATAGHRDGNHSNIGSSSGGSSSHGSSGSAGAGDLFATAKTRRQVSAQAQRAFAFFRLQHYARAVKDYDACLASEPAAALLYYNRGCALYAWGKKQRAVQDFTRALKLDCKNPLYVESRAAVSKELGRFQEAIQDYTWLETLRRMTQHTKQAYVSQHPHHVHDASRGQLVDGRASHRHKTAPESPHESESDDGVDDGPRESLATMRGSFSMTLSELQATLMGGAIGGGDTDHGSGRSKGSGRSRPPSSSMATEGLTTEERETHVLEWMVRFLQRSPQSRTRSDLRDAVQHARNWSFFRGMDAAMIAQCLEDAEYAHYDSDAVVVEQGVRASHFHVVLNPTAPFVKNIDAQSGVSKLRELKKLSQGAAVGTDAFAVSFGDGTLRTIRYELEAAAAAQAQAQSLQAAQTRLRRSHHHQLSPTPSRHRSLHALLDAHATLAMLTLHTGTGSDELASLLPVEPASFTSLEPVHCLLLEVDTYRDILHDHEEHVLEERVAFLRGCRVFRSCSDDVLTALAAVSGARVYDPGRDLLRTGDEVTQLCVIKRGVCQVRKTIRVPVEQKKKKTTTTKAHGALSPLRRRKGSSRDRDETGTDREQDAAPLASSRSNGDGSWVLDNGWMLTNPRLVNNAQGDAKEVPMIIQDVNVGILASGQVFGELSVLQPGQPSQVTIHSQTLVEVLVFAQSDLARLHVQYHSGTMNALQDSLLFHNPPQQKIVQLQRDLARWQKQKRGVLGELALQLPSKAQSVLRGAACMATHSASPTRKALPSPMRRRASLVAVPPLSPLTRHKSIKLLRTNASLPTLSR